MTDPACEHPDTRICWSRWFGSEDEDRYRCAVDLCAVCSTVLNWETLWESEIVTRPSGGAS